VKNGRSKAIFRARHTTLLMIRTFPFFVGLCLVVTSEAAAPIRPNPQLTPGATLAVTTTDVCVPGYTAKVRHVPARVKREVFAEYQVKPVPKGYEVDHLISLELGGSNSIRNLWPQSYTGTYNARQKDVLENRLHKLACAGTMTLPEAQHAIATDWIGAYQKYVVARPRR
jgi:hypothetical protein